MAKLRRNHDKESSSPGTGMMVKVGVFVVILGGLFWAFNQFSGNDVSFSEAVEQAEEILNKPSNEEGPAPGPGSPGIPSVPTKMFPTSTTGQIIKHEYYALSYAEEHEQAEWVAYELTEENLKYPNVDRGNNFRADPKVSKASASWRDYKGTGYNKGHLVPAADMAFSENAMSESFYMSNMSPQIGNFNGGIWRELEENVRDWAYRFDHIFVVTGPILTKGIRERIGPNEVSVPDLYYKVILDYYSREKRAIAFLMPNEVSTEPIMNYAVSIDHIEDLTGIDFFPELLSGVEEEQLESKFYPNLWRVSEKRFKLRREEWNKPRGK